MSLISVLAGVHLGMCSVAFVLFAVFGTCIMELVVRSSLRGLT